MAKLKGRSRPKLTLDKLMSGVSFRYRTVDGQLRKLEAAVEFMKNEHYVDEMFLHVKPSGDSEDEKFERLIERLLLEGPVAVSFEYFPSYRTGIVSFDIFEYFRIFSEFYKDQWPYSCKKNNFKKKIQERILSPTLTERLRNPYEHTSKHVGLLMGSGIELVDGEPKHFWDIYESRGASWRDCGFDRLALHEGLILQATEMRL